jgi:hypothetical protein
MERARVVTISLRHAEISSGRINAAEVFRLRCKVRSAVERRSKTRKCSQVLLKPRRLPGQTAQQRDPA